MADQICLKCARQEYDKSKSTCHCGGTLWHPQQGTVMGSWATCVNKMKNQTVGHGLSDLHL